MTPEESAAFRLARREAAKRRELRKLATISSALLLLVLVGFVYTVGQVNQLHRAVAEREDRITGLEGALKKALEANVQCLGDQGDFQALATLLEGRLEEQVMACYHDGRRLIELEESEARCLASLSSARGWLGCCPGGFSCPKS